MNWKLTNEFAEAIMTGKAGDLKPKKRPGTRGKVIDCQVPFDGLALEFIDKKTLRLKLTNGGQARFFLDVPLAIDTKKGGTVHVAGGFSGIAPLELS